MCIPQLTHPSKPSLVVSIILIAMDNFWSELGGKVDLSALADGADSQAADSGAVTLKLLKVNIGEDMQQSYSTDLICEGKLDPSRLDDGSVFIVDQGDSLHLWVGKKAKVHERKEAMVVAERYLRESGRGASTRLSKVVEGAETTDFRLLFNSWNRKRPGLPLPSSKEPPQEPDEGSKEIDVASLHAAAAADESSWSEDPGTGVMEVWRIEDFKKVKVPDAEVGQFYAGDSYIILYKFRRQGRDEEVIYFWQGKDSSQDEKGTSAWLAKELDDEMGGRPVQVRVVQGKEPNHFTKLFNGAMIVKKGGKASGFRNSTETDECTRESQAACLYRINGTSKFNTSALEVEPSSSNLNGGDCFVLTTKESTVAWIGNGANQSEREATAIVADTIKVGEVAVVDEGSEPDAFWDALGGKSDYPAVAPGASEPYEPRLFQCSNATGAFAVDEVCNFDQSDLVEDDVMLLDCYTEVFLWLGSGCNQQEKKDALKTAMSYIATATDGRDKDTPIIVIDSRKGPEPQVFAQHFLDWDSNFKEKQTFVDPYKLKQQSTSDTDPSDVPSPSPSSASVSTPIIVSRGSNASELQEALGIIGSDTTMKLSELAGGPVEGIDNSKKESYLNKEDFEEAMGMTREDFYNLPKWRQKDKKKN